VPDDLRLEDGTLIDGDELSVSFVRSGGPGGQHVNTSATRVELRFDVHASASLGPVQKQRVVDALGNRLTRDGALVVRVSDFRSQARNREVARTRLAALLSRALRPARPRRATRVPRSSRRRRLDAKRRRSDRKQLRRRPDAP
jgi:ribosome-associated protein